MLGQGCVSGGGERKRQKPDGFVNVDSGLGNSKIALSKNKQKTTGRFFPHQEMVRGQILLVAIFLLSDFVVL